MAEINCPMCGKANPADWDACQYCEARLKPLTDELSRSQPPIRPGEEPKEVDTGQLESVLPKWLRDIRQQSRESEEEEPEQSAGEKEARDQDPGTDRLAGFPSSVEDEEEIPSWLAGLRGEGGKATFGETSKDEDDMAALRSMFGDEPSAPSKEEESALPDWMSGRDAGQEEQTEADRWPEFREETSQEPAEQDQSFSASDSDFKWEADFGSGSTAPPESTEAEQPFDSELPAWLRDIDETPAEATDSGLPAWLSAEEPTAGEGESAPPSTEGDLPAWLQDKGEPQQDLDGDTGLPGWLNDEAPDAPVQEEAVSSSGAADLPAWLASLGEEEAAEEASAQFTDEPASRSTTDWLSSLDEEKTESELPESFDSAVKSTTDWLASLDGEPAEITAPQEPDQPAPAEELPDWLSSLGAESTESESQQEPDQPSAASDLPDWLSSLGEESDEAPPQEGSGTPAWLSSLGDEQEPAAQEEDLFPASDEAMEPSQAPAESGVPDWLAAMGEAPEADEQVSEGLEPSSFAPEENIAETSLPSPFVNDEGEPISSEDVDAIFSMGMPDWLSDAQGAPGESAEIESEEEPEDKLRPAELPSWVQAMRPVESVVTETTGAQLEDQPVEERGPLAGLRGVLPAAAAGLGPTSKPRAYSLKLQASEDQLESAALLESMLAAEVNPAPVVPQKLVLNQRILRWIIATVLLLVVGAAVFLSPQMNPILPSVPPETSDALNYVRDTLPANEQVLLVFDYEAARAGEMEAAAAPLLDQMITLKSPRLTLVSSTPTGSGLAERLMGILFVDRPYTRNENFVNLGYLPGGAAGVQAFAGNPVTTKRFTTTGEAAWSTPALQGVSAISDFSTIILLTDDIETARIWIEQTEGLRTEAQLLVVSSAQSGPMIRPYERSGQVLGMVTGLDNSAPIEDANRGRPGMARRYWDAYGYGLLAAAVMVVIGSLWSLFTNLQANRREGGKK